MAESNDELLKYQLQQMNNNVQQLSSDVRHLTTVVGKLETMLFHDEKTGSVGVMKRMDNVEQRIDKLEEKERFKTKLWAIATSVGGVVSVGLWKLIEFLVSK